MKIKVTKIKKELEQMIALFLNTATTNSATFKRLGKELSGFSFDEYEDIILFDFNYDCITSTIYFDEKKNELYLSGSCDIWDDACCSLITENYEW